MSFALYRTRLRSNDLLGVIGANTPVRIRPTHSESSGGGRVNSRHSSRERRRRAASAPIATPAPAQTTADNEYAMCESTYGITASDHNSMPASPPTTATAQAHSRRPDRVDGRRMTPNSQLYGQTNECLSSNALITFPPPRLTNEFIEHACHAVVKRGHFPMRHVP